MNAAQRFTLVVVALATTIAVVSFGMPHEVRAQATSFRDRVKASIDVGIKHLRFQQQEDGSWNGDVEATALILRSMMESHRQYRATDGPFVARPLRYLAGQLRDDGSVAGPGNVYRTALVVHVLALSADPEYRTLVESGLEFLRRALRGDDAVEIRDDHLAFVLDALEAASVPRSDPLWPAAGRLFARVSQPTAARLYARLRLGQEEASVIAHNALAMLREPSLLGAPGSASLEGSFRDVYFLSASLAAAEDLAAVEVGDDIPRAWQEVIGERLMELQEFDGYWPAGHHAEGRESIASPLALLALEEIYRR